MYSSVSDPAEISPAFACASPSTGSSWPPAFAEPAVVFLGDCKAVQRIERRLEVFGEPGEILDGLFLEGVNGANGATGSVVSLSGEVSADGVYRGGDELRTSSPP
jgi:hypothetical protein